MGNFGMLPVEIMLDIFCRLPTESVLDCKSVSKTWNDVIQHPSFSQLHFNQLNAIDSAYSGKHSFLFLLNDKNMSRQFYHVEYDENEKNPSLTVKKMNFRPPFKSYSFVGSCNGLICLSGLPAHYTFDKYDQASYVAYICDPITRESVTLPELKRRTMVYDAVNFCVIGFGYVPSINEYKVVRLYRYVMEPKFAEVEVYTLGSGKGWRNEGKKISIGSACWLHGVFANGCIYWKFGRGKIVAFDLSDEMFVELPEFSEFSFKDIRLGVLGDCLCASHYTAAKIADVWLLKKKQDESLMIWSKGFTLTDMDGYDIPLAVMSSGTVLCHSDFKIHLYDLKLSSPKMLVNFGRACYQALPHRNTVVSIEALGERTEKHSNTVKCDRGSKRQGLADLAANIKEKIRAASCLVSVRFEVRSSDCAGEVLSTAAKR